MKQTSKQEQTKKLAAPNENMFKSTKFQLIQGPVVQSRIKLI